MAIGLWVFDSFRFEKAESDERYVVGFALGVLAFAVVLLLLGFLQLWTAWTSILLPTAFILVGRRQLWNALGGLASTMIAARGSRLLVAAVATIGVIGLVLVYLPIVSPANVGYDSRWYHLAVAEQYAIQGGMVTFTEGWINGAQPQLAAALYGWAFLIPGATPFDQIELSMHLEFTVFVATLASVPALARLLTGSPQRFAWVFMLLFPGLYLYDSNLIGAADHIAALFAIPVALASYRAWREFFAALACLGRSRRFRAVAHQVHCRRAPDRPRPSVAGARNIPALPSTGDHTNPPGDSGRPDRGPSDWTGRHRTSLAQELGAIWRPTLPVLVLRCSLKTGGPRTPPIVSLGSRKMVGPPSGR